MALDWHQWVSEERSLLRTEDASIRAFTPKAEAYARVLFPVTTAGSGPTTWSQAFGFARLTAETVWPEERARSLGVGSAYGEVPPEVTAVLIDVLEAAAAVRDEPVVFAWWSGYGDAVAPPDVHRGVLPPDDREMWFASSQLDALPALSAQVGRGPTRWLPTGHTWSVTSDIYDRSVIVAGSAQLVNAVISEPALEAIVVSDRMRRAALS